MLIKKASDIRSSEITSQKFYQTRREFIKAAGMVTGAAVGVEVLTKGAAVLHAARLKVDVEIDLRLANVDAHAGIFEGQVLHILRHDLNHRRGPTLGCGRGRFSAIGIGVFVGHDLSIPR